MFGVKKGILDGWVFLGGALTLTVKINHSVCVFIVAGWGISQCFSEGGIKVEVQQYFHDFCIGLRRSKPSTYLPDQQRQSRLYLRFLNHQTTPSSVLAVLSTAI